MSDYLYLHKNIYYCTKELTDEEFGLLIRGAFHYLLTKRDPELEGDERLVFPFLKYLIDEER